MKSNKLILLFIVFSYHSCKFPNNKAKIEYYPNGTIKRVFISQDDKNLGKEILFFANGNIKTISNFADTLLESEQLRFYETNGHLRSKVQYKNNLANGVAYWFYESGALKSSRNYEDNKEWYLGFNYWDDSFVVNKTLLRFNRNGNVYYKLNFDSTGKPADSEGDSLHSGIETVQ